MYARALSHAVIAVMVRSMIRFINRASLQMEREYFMDIYRFLSEACEILSLLLIFKDSNHTVFDSGYVA